MKFFNADMAAFSFYISVLATVILAYFIYKVVTWSIQYKKWLDLSDKFVHIPFHWFFGVVHKLTCFKDLFKIHQEIVDAGHKSLFYWIGPFRPVVSVVHPETIKTILRTSSPKSRGSSGYSLIVPWLGEGLLVSEGKLWERNRRLLTSAFHFEILQPYVGIYNSTAEVFMDKIEEGCQNGEFIEVFQPVSLATLDTMLQCAFSYHGKVQELGSNHPYVEAVNRLSKLILSRSIKLHLHWEPIYKLSQEGKEFYRLCDYVHKFAEDIISKRKKELKDETQREYLQKQHLDFLDILLTARDEQGTHLSDTEIRNEVDTFLFEGHDTTASAVSWCFYALAKHPEIQEKVYSDVRQVLDVSTDLEWKNLAEFKYLLLVIKETMRYFSPVPTISRRLIEPMDIDGVTVPVGTIIDINIEQIHHNPNVWPNPEKFDPDRFHPDVFTGKDPYAFVPFSAGPRNCIGQNFAMNEMKTLVSRVVHRFKIEFDESRIPETVPELVNRAKNGLYLRFTPRDKEN